MQNSILNQTEENALRIGDKVQYDFKDTRTEWHKRERAGDYEQFSGKQIGFDQTSPRFNFNQVFYGQSLKFDIPGPGQYQVGGRFDHINTAKPRNRSKLVQKMANKPKGEHHQNSAYNTRPISNQMNPRQRIKS